MPNFTEVQDYISGVILLKKIQYCPISGANVIS